MAPTLQAGLTVPAVTDGPLTTAAAFHAWWADRHRTGLHRVREVDFAELRDWGFDERTGNLCHASGRFFSVEGLEVREGGSVIWQQPIINQPEIGILGIVVKVFDGVLHCLMQAKMEPGNVNVLQLSPTVQATRSNYTRVHRGGGTPYLEHFVGPGRGEVLVDVLQSEQGAWFWRKRNRNMVVLVTEDIPVHDSYCWLSVDQLRSLTQVDNLVNMDARTVLSCMPFTFPDETETDGRDAFRDALIRSYQYQAAPGVHGPHSAAEILSWFIEAKTACDWSARLTPLREVAGWAHDHRELRDAAERHFRIIGVSVEARDREVGSWTQPLLAPRGEGRAVFLVRAVDGVLQLLVQARPEYGLMDMVEMAPTVHLLPGEDLSAIEEEALRTAVTDAGTEGGPTVRYDTVQSEEGGRFYHALTRYQIIQVDSDFMDKTPPGHLWMTLRQLTDLLRHGHYLNIEARSLLACLHSLC